MGLAQTKNLHKPEEYLELERKSEVRHENINGEIFEMPGAGKRPNQISANLIRLLAI
jgi:Uma2 family endonuclease